MSLMPVWVWAAIIAGLTALLGIQTVRISSLHADIAETAAAHERDVAKQQEQRAETERQARAREQKLTADAAALLEQKQNENADIAGRLDAALVSLRNRAERPAASASAVPGATSACKGATGSELFRSDAEFLSREAARADRVRAALAECYGRYDSLTQKQVGL